MPDQPPTDANRLNLSGLYLCPAHQLDSLSVSYLCWLKTGRAKPDRAVGRKGDGNSATTIANQAIFHDIGRPPLV